MRRLFFILSTAITLALTAACTEKRPEEVVQAGVLPTDRSVTVGGALSAYPFCAEKSAKWQTSVSKKGATVVTFSCQLSNATEAFKQRYADSLISLTTEGLSTIFNGVLFKHPEKIDRIEEAEALLDALLDKIQAPEDLREQIYAVIAPYKVKEAEIALDFAIDRTNKEAFQVTDARMTLVWEDRKGLMQLPLDATLTALYRDQSLFADGVLKIDLDDAVEQLWQASAPEKTETQL